MLIGYQKLAPLIKEIDDYDIIDLMHDNTDAKSIDEVYTMLAEFNSVT